MYACLQKPWLAISVTGDTGLLDHLLRHLVDQPVTAEGDRLKRRHNADGHMEYWLQSPAAQQAGARQLRCPRHIFAQKLASACCCQLLWLVVTMSCRRAKSGACALCWQPIADLVISHVHHARVLVCACTSLGLGTLPCASIS